MIGSPELMVAGVGVVAMAAQWLAWRVQVPAILFLLLAGLAVGPVGGWLDPDELFGPLLFPFISLSVAVILFEGSLTLEFHQIRDLKRVVRRMVTGGTVIAWCVTTLASHWIMAFPWDIAFLFGALTVVTGPTVIAPLLRTVRPVAAVAHTLRWEGILIDPIGALLAVLAYELMLALRSTHDWGHAMAVFGVTILAGVVGGLFSGWAVSALLRRKWLPDSLLNLSILALLFAAFALSNAVRPESGLLTVTIMGVWMANAPGVPVEDILEFKETLSQLLLSALFILLAARMDLGMLAGLGWGAGLVLLIMLSVGRPLKVLFSTWGSTLNWRERFLIGWIAPRGIVAAAVSALFALRLEHLGVPHAEKLLPLTFVVIIGTVVWQSLTARPMARLLGLTLPDPVGFLIVGANPVARAIGLALQENGVPVRLSDSDWYSLAKARMAGLPTYYGNPFSEHARRNLDTDGLGRLLALGARDQLNEITMLRGREEFGKQNVFSLPRSQLNDAAEKHALDPAYRGRALFYPGLGYWRLSALLAEGAQIKTTRLSKEFGFEQYRANGGPRTVYPLFAITPKGYAIPFTQDQTVQPETGWTVIGLYEKEGTEPVSLSEPHVDSGAESPSGVVAGPAQSRQAQSRQAQSRQAQSRQAQSGDAPRRSTLPVSGPGGQKRHDAIFSSGQVEGADRGRRGRHRPVPAHAPA